MRNLSAVADLHLDKRRVRKDNSYPVKLKITFNRDRKYYKTTINLTEEDWNAVNGNRIPRCLHKISEDLLTVKVNAQNCIRGLGKFSFHNFEEAFFPKRLDKKDVESAYKEYIDNLNEEERFGSANAYQCSITALLKFKPNLKFEHITASFLEKFEKHLMNNNYSVTTVGIYLRPLRAIINKEIQNNNFSLSDYPFAKGKYKIPTGRNIKKALTKEIIKQIADYDTGEDQLMDYYRDLWMFSFYCNGMNTADICHLKFKNIQGNMIVFQRQKTLRTYKRNPKYIKVAITHPIQQILKKWKALEIDAESYIFPLLNYSLTPFQIKEKTRIVSHSINAQMARIANEIGYEGKITTYSARHSYATILLNLGAPIKLVSDNLGHSAVSVTDNYLDGFNQDVIIDYAEKMTNLFKVC